MHFLRLSLVIHGRKVAFVSGSFSLTSYRGGWKNRASRRKFLIRLATSKGLDPFNPKTWTTITQNDVLAAKVSEVDSSCTHC
jgi:hypothetical protein